MSETTKSKPKLSSREQKRQARQALKSARSGRSSGLDALDNDDDEGGQENNDDVYEQMTEEEYRQYVERKREREDFVVDDDGLGYHDDGDYDILGMAAHDDEYNNPSKKKKKGSGNNALTKEVLKKARKNKASLKAAVEGGGSGEGEGGSGKGNRSMWDFVNKSNSANATKPTTSSSTTTGGGDRGSKNRGIIKSSSTTAANNNTDDLDDLLNGLDYDAPTSSSHRGGGGRRSSNSGTRRGGASRGHHHQSSRKRVRESHRSRSRGPSSSHRGRSTSGGASGGRARYDNNGDDDNVDNFGGDGNDVDFGNDNDAFGNHDMMNEGAEEENVEASAEDVEMEDVANNNNKSKDNSDDDDEANEEKNDDKEVAAAVQQPPTRGGGRPRPGRLAGRLSAAAARAKEAEEKKAADEAAKKLAEESRMNEINKKAAAVVDNKGSTVGGDIITVDTTSTSFQPMSIAAAGTESHAGIGGGGGMDLERIIEMEPAATVVEEEEESMEVDDDGKEKTKEEAAAAKPQPRPYLDMYWLDASERHGVVSLFGKVKVPIINSNKGSKKSGQEEQKFIYQSCCVTIPNNERNLFVLPRRVVRNKSDNAAAGEDDNEEEEESNSQQERYPIGEVYGELKSILQPSCIPLVQGANWKAKPVTRSYAFEDPSIPRGECQYLKVVYDGKYPVPDRQVCTNGGKTFEKILGAGASNLENFLIKRRLMGPGWVRIYDPNPLSGGNVSWCKWECTIDGPKSLKRLDLISINGEKVVIPPSPPVSAVSIKFKTVVNPKSHKLEIVCASAICHSNVMLDGASDETPRHMTQLTIVRPVNFDSNGAMAQFPRDMDKESKAMPELKTAMNERALLSRLFAQLGTWDPDVIVSHHGWGHDIDVLLNRCVELKVGMWSKIGRRRQMRLPSASQFGNGKDWAISQALEGRVLCDTLLSAKEFVRETTYSLTHLAKTQLKAARVEIEPVDVPNWCKTGKHFVSLAKHTLNDAELVQRLMFKLQVLPLTKQLTNIAGNLWGRTMKGNRAERNEYLLLHEFHQLKYIVPEKLTAKQRKEDAEEGGATAGSNNKAKYGGGLVLEPKKGLYDSFILLLDFNSLYPSLIQEYNLCFTTMEWNKCNTSNTNAEGRPQGDDMPSLPDVSLDRGVLPRVIKTLVDRRRQVKKFMKTEKNVDKKAELDIRQLALKLTANSMYGCLGFSHSRFYAQPIAALITAMGRETLQRTVDLAQTTIGLEVIYGDTDSVMINTRITDVEDYKKVLALGNQVKREVNKLYNTLELEIDGVFRSMLLLKKKKYAAVTMSEGPDGKFIFDKEMKGLDLVRRDWCIQSKDSGRFVLDQILSGEEKETVVNNIHDHLEKVAAQMRSGELPLDKYVITKGLNKHPKDYPDAKTLPHVYVANRMVNEHKAVSIGDHIPYVITEEKKDEEGEKQQQATTKKSLATERARHPEEITRSNGALKPDVEWYLTQQILPPISRLCEPIEGTSPGILAEKLGLDSTKYNNVSVDIDEDDIVDYTPASCLPDEERFKDVEKLVMTCLGCNEEAEFPGVFRLVKDVESGMTFCQSGLRCPNPQCQHADNWGEADMWSCVAKILNKMNLLKKEKQRAYYDGLVRCDDPMCNLETRQLSVYEGCCLKQGCNGRMKTVFTESALQTQLKYFDSLFDMAHALKQLKRSSSSMTEKEVTKSISGADKDAFQMMHGFSSHALNQSGYNWVSGGFFQTIFGGVVRS